MKASKQSKVMSDLSHESETENREEGKVSEKPKTLFFRKEYGNPRL